MQWIFPPGGVIITVLLIFLFFHLGRKKIAACLTVCFLFFLFLFSTWFGEYILLRPLEDDYISFPAMSFDNSEFSKPIIVVLGGGLVENSLAESTGGTEIGEITLSRIYGAYRIYKILECPLWVSGGNVPGYSGDKPATDIMEQVLIELGVPLLVVYKESQSRTTLENAEFTLDELKQKGYQEIILVTSAVHMRRSVQVFENDVIRIIPAPVNYLFENSKPGILKIISNRFSWDYNLRALHEWVGLFYYKLLN